MLNRIAKVLRVLLTAPMLLSVGWPVRGAASMDSPTAGSPTVLISEFRTRGPNGGNDEFIELYNRSSAAVAIGGWKIWGSNSARSVRTRLTIKAGTVLPAHGHWLAANSATGGYGGTVAGDQTYTTGISDDGGIALTLPDDTVVDMVGMSAGSAFKEGTPLAPRRNDLEQSCERRPGGAQGSSIDSADNAADFFYNSGKSDPQNLLSPLTPPGDRLVGVGKAAPEVAANGESVLLTVQVIPALDPVSSGLAVRSDLSGIGAGAAQDFYDDGTRGDGTAGDLIFSSQSVVSMSAAPGTKSLGVTISDAQGRTGSAAIQLTVVGNCGMAFTPLPAIQGSGAASALVNAVVETEGVVVGDFQAAGQMGGFFIQDPVGDGSAQTSDGLFVYQPGASEVSAGDRVRVRGTVQEYKGQTEISPVVDLRICGTGTVVETPISLPETVAGELERYEGMLVFIRQELTVSDTYWLGQYGQVTLSAIGRMFNPTNGQGGAADLNARRGLVLDDGRSARNPRPLPYWEIDQPLRGGDVTGGLLGVLDEGPAGDGQDYRLQPVSTPVFVHNNPRTSAPPKMEGNLKVASFNVHNYFTTLGSRGANTPEEFQRQRAKIIAALTAIDADIVGLVEVENNVESVVDLVSGLNAAAQSGKYAAIAEPSPGTDSIKVALMYQPGRVSPVGSAANYQVDTSAYSPLFNRPPLAQTFELLSNGQRLTVVVNHFKSKSCDSASGADADLGQGCWNAKRTQQARALLDFVSSLQVSRGDADVLVMGDLNAYGEEDPIHTLTGGGLRSEVARWVGLAERYSYTFAGLSGCLDHALATPALNSQVTGAAFWHINADEPAALDYQNADLTQPDAYRSSDHDPLVVEISLKPGMYIPIVRR